MVSAFQLLMGDGGERLALASEVYCDKDIYHIGFVQGKASP